ncbi:MAG: nucleotidyl transferase AbiEii/AbiGii toxin family protein [Phycisphaerae bacterium]|nr:nucleotidyl transferase AbiEii/AbiGii toxin family protein [Planctomycetota bacterium]MBL7221132.1 nucleotidyl transferase AbiEii/AbiGii toxin family protein [Phycisphaerae bacterium]
MSPRPIRDMAASVKQRLLNLAKKRGEDFNFLLGRFAVERFLFRLSQSSHGEDFVLKGAMLFHLRSMRIPHRPTHDLDLLGMGTPDITRIETVFQDVCRTEAPDDGLIFLEDHIQGERIKDDDEYKGVRLHLEARMGSARIPLQIDVGFGDAITPPPEQEQLLTLLDFPPPVILTYAWETMIAEKFHAIVELGMDNSRMKDYFDLNYLATTQAFDGPVLAQAIGAAFARRKTALPKKLPVGLLPSFGEDAIKQTQWRAFLRKLQMAEGSHSLNEIIAGLQVFLIPPVDAVLRKEPFTKSWEPGGPWRE